MRIWLWSWPIKSNDTLTIADAYKVKGKIRNNNSDSEFAEELFENSLRLNKDFENKYNYAESLHEIKDLHRQDTKANVA